MVAPSNRPLTEAMPPGPVPYWRVLWDELLYQQPGTAPKSDYSDAIVGFQPAEIRNSYELAQLLSDPKDLLAQHLRDVSTTQEIQDILGWLNSLLPLSVYDPIAFERVQFRNATRHFLQLVSPSDAERKVLNRHLLEDAFPDQLRSLENRLLKEVFQKIQEVRGSTTAALCLSGGGIRSATFSLGVIQALARGKMLSQFDYLSTVSGGGYIGSWLSSWIHRHPEGLIGVEEDLNPAAGFGGQTAAGALSPEPEPLRHLRSYSKYLSPRTGLLSADVWTLVAIVLRNLAVHWSVFLPLLFALLAVPRLCVSVIRAPWLYHHIGQFGRSFGSPYLFELLSFGYHWLLPLLGLAASVWALSYIRLHLPSSGTEGKRDQGRFLWHVIVPLAVFAISITTYWAWNRSLAWMSPHGAVVEHGTLWWIRGLAFLPFVLSAVIYACVVVRRPNRNNRTGKQKALSVLWNVFMILAAGLSAGQLLSQMATSYLLSPVTHPLAYVCFATPLFLMAFLLVSVILVGLASRWMSDGDREWLARAGGWVFSLAVTWALLSSLVLYGPKWILFLNGTIQAAVASAGGVAGLAYSLYKGFSSHTPATANCKTSGSNGWMLKIAVAIAVVMIAVWVSWTTGAGLSWYHSGLHPMLHNADPFRNEVASGWLPPMTLLFVTPGFLVFVILIVAGTSVVLDLVVNLNDFSIHSLYRNRLIRSYLGASRPFRRPNPFTGFDPNDDLQMSDLEWERPPANSLPARQRPLHVVNASLNLVHGEELAWQQRKASAFIFTPLYCGNSRLGYRQSIDYARRDSNAQAISLGTAVTISGAAVSPNMGYHSSALVTFLLTLFNVRLGWWLGNPGSAGEKFYTYPAPQSALWHLTREALGYTDDRSSFVYLSDGGHFENLALYSMVERRCHLIVIVDAECDPKAAFEGLGNAIRKIQVDMGVPISIDYLPIYSRRDTEKKDGRYCAIGTVQYSKIDLDASDGTLIYLKPTLCGNEPVDVRNYASGHPEFPHETTGDQWFDETQFESYRKLGEWIATKVFDIPERAVAAPVGGLCGTIQRLRERWYAPSPHTKEAFLQHAAQVDRIFELIRNDKYLRFLDAQIYPEWRVLMQGTQSASATTGLWLPASEEERRAGFYACSRMIQLMENVYLGLNLEDEWDHLDNRGWMNLFRHWSWSGMFRVTYAICASTYGARFQSFCKRHLELEPLKHVSLGSQLNIRNLRTGSNTVRAFLEAGGLNFLEIRMLESLLSAGRLTNDDLIVSFVFQIQDPANPSTHLDVTFGFAVIGQVLVRSDKLGRSGPSVLVSALRCLRVQDHLRRMGLGRKALCRLIQDRRLQLAELDLMPPEQLPADFPEKPLPPEYARLKRLYEQAVAEMVHSGTVQE